MTWSSSGDSDGYAIELYSTDPAALVDIKGAQITSTSTVIDASGTGGLARLFGFDNGQANLTFGPAVTTFSKVSSTPTSPWVTKYTAAGATVTLQQYVDATLAGTSPSIYLQIDGFTTKFTECDVPQRITGHAVTWYQLSRGASVSASGAGPGAVANPTPAATKQVAAAGTVYELIKDVHVVELPGLGWLMVAARYIYDATTTTVDASSSMGQIIAWWSPNEDFHSRGLVGPFLLVDGAQCVSDDQALRLWVGVPSVAVVDDGVGSYDLYLYYQVESCGLGQRGAAVTSLLYDDIEPADYQSETNALGVDSTRALGVAWGAIGVKRLALETLMSAVSDELLGADTWTDEAAWRPSSALDGDLLGLVRLWFADNSGTAEPGALSVRPFFTQYDEESVHFADAVGTTCGHAPRTLGLWLVANASSHPDAQPIKEAVAADPATGTTGTRGSGHGLWRGRGLPTGALLADGSTSITELSILGRDFVFAPIDASTNLSPDQIAESTSSNILLDPDPVQLADGSWWCMAGAIGSSGMGNTQAWAGLPSDGCASWVGAFADGAWIWLGTSAGDARGDWSPLPDFDPRADDLVFTARVRKLAPGSHAGLALR